MLRATNKSKLTIENYNSDIRQWDKWAKKKEKGIYSLGVEEVEDISTNFSNKEIKVNNALTFTEEEILSGIKRAKEDNVCPQFLDRLRKSNKNIFLNTIKNYIE